ncbi:hypothetical protein D3C86_2157480 [compost metagenome]
MAGNIGQTFFNDMQAVFHQQSGQPLVQMIFRGYKDPGGIIKMFNFIANGLLEINLGC